MRSAPLQFHIFTQKFISRGSQGSFYPAIKICRISKINKKPSRPTCSWTLSRFPRSPGITELKKDLTSIFKPLRLWLRAVTECLHEGLCRDLTTNFHERFCNFTSSNNISLKCKKSSNWMELEQFLSSITFRAGSCCRVSLLPICLCSDLLTNKSRRQNNWEQR